MRFWLDDESSVLAVDEASELHSQLTRSRYSDSVSKLTLRAREEAEYAQKQQTSQ